VRGTFGQVRRCRIVYVDYRLVILSAAKNLAGSFAALRMTKN
jgi:hypothetical protein